MTIHEDIAVITHAADTLEARLTRLHRCPKCDTVKPVTEFARNNHKSSGHGSYCLPCHREVINAYRHTDAGKLANRLSAQASRAKRLARA
ncbi:hypothetical protein E3T24_04770 [Cryobacterium sp. TmT2-59]|uniref:hypothetical protein n=1 Tax=unclassified Cryobacterium TaxID=2649013 RepID=UPI00106BEFED|nr:MULTISPECIES: hypothetical protein [unclassified Cryobacterium]TFB58708.1 hypothetical protein E3N86_13430 [Cryobacterium sp. Hz7]TFC87508.1 hypothetical protein E3T24_04770 [Cryobacterium sp. TmT2-59]